MRGVNRFASVLLWPFWLVGRVIAALSVAAVWVKGAFLDGLNTGAEDRDLDALFLIWLVALTVWVLV